MSWTELFWGLVALLVIALLAWWFDIFCFSRLSKRWASKEACQRFCTYRKENGCQVPPEEAGRQCDKKHMHEEAVVRFISFRERFKGKGERK